ncbi:MAG: hypothetical protein C3F16_03535 [Betaproteobacteria bacterium]|nr:MAG: hypothetical protein C3F16_03535 [Betaproteobacteria bacterium]
MHPEGGGGTEAAVIAMLVLVSVPRDAPPVGFDRVTWHDVLPAALPAPTVMEAGEAEVEPSAKETLVAESVQPPVTPTVALTAPEVPLLRETPMVVWPLVTAIDDDVLAVFRTSVPGDWAVMFTDKVDGLPRLALPVASVTVQEVFWVAPAALRVTEAGDGTPEPLEKLTTSVLRVQPPVTLRLPLTAPVVPPVRATVKVVEPLVTGMPVAVPKVFSASVPASGVAVLPVQENERLPLASPMMLANGQMAVAVPVVEFTVNVMPAVVGEVSVTCAARAEAGIRRAATTPTQAATARP